MTKRNYVAIAGICTMYCIGLLGVVIVLGISITVFAVKCGFIAHNCIHRPSWSVSDMN